MLKDTDYLPDPFDHGWDDNRKGVVRRQNPYPDTPEHTVARLDWYHGWDAAQKARLDRIKYTGSEF